MRASFFIHSNYPPTFLYTRVSKLISIYSSKDFLIEKNTFSNLGSGIIIDNNSSGVIKENKIIDTEGNVISCTNKSDVLITNNTITNIKYPAIFIGMKSSASIQSNKISKMERNGLAIRFAQHVEIEGNESEKSKQDLNQMKKDRARKIKESIMIHFKSLSSSFSLEGDESDELLKTQSSTENEVCSICSTHKKNEIFAYPLYVYRTKFPFIIDKPPMLAKDEVADEKRINTSNMFRRQSCVGIKKTSQISIPANLLQRRF